LVPYHWKLIAMLALRSEGFKGRITPLLSSVTDLSLETADLLDDEAHWLIESSTSLETVAFRVYFFTLKD